MPPAKTIHVDLAGDTRPNPDPTILTTQQTIREIASLRDFFAARMVDMGGLLHAQREILETRLGGMDKAINLVQATTDRIPNAVDEKISALREIFEEKFSSVQVQFKERDVRTEQSSKDSKVAVDAALQAAKEAVGEQNRSAALAIAKSEASTIKQIDQQGVLIGQITKAVDDKFSDIKERLTRIEGKDEGSVATVATTAATNTNLIAIVGLVVGAIGIAIGAAVAFVTKH